MAAQLIEAVHRVTGLDTSAEALVEAAARGLSVHRAAWPDYADEPFDALLFTRSLHHIDPLEGALAQAHALLRPGGWLIVEDFAYLEADRETVTWLCHVLRLLDAGGALERAAHTFGRQLLAATEAYDLWRADHRHVGLGRGGVEADRQPHVVLDQLVDDLLLEQDPVARDVDLEPPALLLPDPAHDVEQVGRHQRLAVAEQGHRAQVVELAEHVLELLEVHRADRLEVREVGPPAEVAEQVAVVGDLDLDRGRLLVDARRPELPPPTLAGQVADVAHVLQESHGTLSPRF